MKKIASYTRAVREVTGVTYMGQHKYKTGQKSCEKERHSGRPKDVTKPEMIKKFRNLFWMNFD